MKVAYYSPMPPSRSGIADYSALLLPALRERIEELGVADPLLPLLGEPQPDVFPLAGVVLDLAEGLMVPSHYVERRAREAGYDGPVWRVPHRACPDTPVSRAEITGDPLIGCFGYLNAN